MTCFIKNVVTALAATRYGAETSEKCWSRLNPERSSSSSSSSYWHSFPFVIASVIIRFDWFAGIEKGEKQTTQLRSRIYNKGKYVHRKMQEPIKMEVDDSTVKDENIEAPEISYEEKLRFVNSISEPMAPKKLTKKIYKCIKKASKHKTYLRNGLKDVQKHLRKGETGLVVFAGDVYPIDIMCHLPIVCEDNDIPYCFTPSRMDIGTAMGMKRGSLMVLIKEHPDYKDLYDEIKTTMKRLSASL